MINTSLEKINKMLDKRYETDTEFRDKLGSSLLEVFEKAHESKRSTGSERIRQTFFRLPFAIRAAAAGIIFAVAAWGTAQVGHLILQKFANPGVADTCRRAGAKQDTADKSEFAAIVKMYEMNDVAGLTGIIESGTWAQKVLAANYLSKIGDLHSADVLESEGKKAGAKGVILADAAGIIRQRFAGKIKPTETSKQEPNDPNLINVKLSVVDVNGVGVSDAHVKILKAAIGRPYYKFEGIINKRTDEKGHLVFSVPQVKRKKSLVGRAVGFVLVEKAGMACGWSRWEPSESQELEVKLLDPAIVSGIVVDDQNMPVADAAVRLNWITAPSGGDAGYIMAEKPMCAFSTVTGRDGKFTFSLPDNSNFGIIAEKAGMGTTFIEDEVGKPKHVASPISGIVLVMEPAGAIEGRVVDKLTRMPLKDIQIKADSPTAGFLLAKEELTTDGDGRFGFDSLKSGHYKVMISKGLRKTSKWVSEPVAVDVEAGQTAKGVLLEAITGGMAEIKVLDSDGRPVERAYAEVIPADGGKADMTPASDANGISRWGSDPGSYKIKRICNFRWSENCSVDFKIEPGKVTTVEVRVASTMTISGIVRNSDGTGASKVKIVLMPSGEEGAADANGTFVIGYNRNSGYNMNPILIAKDAGRNLAAAMEVADGNKPVELILAGGLTVSGRVVDPNGNGLASQVSILMKVENYGSVSLGNSITSGKDGKFTFKSLPTGLKYEIVASMKDRSRSFKTVESDAVGKVELEPIVLKPVDRIVTGTVVDENDVPVANAQVYPYGEDQPELQSAIRADAQGMFSFKACEGKVNVMVGGGEENQLSGNAVVEAGSNFVKVVIFDRTPKNYKPVKGQKVDGLQEYVSGLDTAGLQGKRLLILFVDINQFPADIVGQNASEQFRKLQAKGVEVIGIQVNKCDAVKFDEWVQKVKCPFSFYIAKNGDELRSKFGVNQVPWIILTDSNHVVSAEGVNGSDFEKELGLHL